MTFIAFLNVQSQIHNNQPAANSVYVEALGVAGYGSLNYERVLIIKNKVSYGLRLGIGTYRIVDYTRSFNPDFILPININCLYGKVHKLEVASGVVLSNTVKAGDFGIPRRKTHLHPNIGIGYRYQATNGFIFRCVYTPLFEFKGPVRQWAGVSLGFAF